MINLNTPALPDGSNTTPGGVEQNHNMVWFIVGAILFYIIVIRGGKI